jgi:hypothetical protein
MVAASIQSVRSLGSQRLLRPFAPRKSGISILSDPTDRSCPIQAIVLSERAGSAATTMSRSRWAAFSPAGTRPSGVSDQDHAPG